MKKGLLHIMWLFHETQKKAKIILYQMINTIILGPEPKFNHNISTHLYIMMVFQQNSWNYFWNYNLTCTINRNLVHWSLNGSWFGLQLMSEMTIWWKIIFWQKFKWSFMQTVWNSSTVCKYITYGMQFLQSS